MQRSRLELQHIQEPKKSGIISIKERSESVTEMDIPTGQSFSSCYMELCKKQKLRPLPVICVTLPHYLEFVTDRVKLDEWSPILNSLSLDRTLKSIGIRSRFQHRKPLEEVNSEAKARAIGKTPVVFTRFLLECLSHSIAQCVSNSPVLTSLELEGIPLPTDCLAVLCMGLSNTQTLRHLSLSKCYIGDASCELICKTIVEVSSIKSLNLSQCDLTTRCGTALAAALSRQKLLLFHDAWQQSLRYREPNLEAMPGLRRLTLNGNSRLGDSVISEIIEAVGDSLWLKALDLQHCGLTDVIGTEILDLLDYNKTLVIVDVRSNPNLREELSQEIVKKLQANNASGRSEYRWLSLPKKDLNKALKRNDQQDDSLAIKAKHRTIKDQRLLDFPRTAPCRPITVKKGKMKQPSSRSLELSKSKISLSVSKQPLHLNLKTEMEPSNDSFNNLESTKSKKVDKLPEMKEEEENEDTETKIVEIGNQVPLDQDENSPTDKDVEDLLRQLAEARTEHERLLEKTKRNELLLTEERVRREMAEAKLRTLNDNLSELENALKEKERQTRGFLLVSQTSLDEICSSFDNLLEMLDRETRNPCVRSESEEESILKADIRTRMALLIRKTKSETLRQGYITEEATKDVKKFARSEANIRNTLPPINLTYLERHIGDSPDIISPSLEGSFRNMQDSFRSIEDSFRKMGDTSRREIPSTATERAKSIFSQILSGNMLLNLGAQSC